MTSVHWEKDKGIEKAPSALHLYVSVVAQLWQLLTQFDDCSTTLWSRESLSQCDLSRPGSSLRRSICWASRFTAASIAQAALGSDLQSLVVILSWISSRMTSRQSPWIRLSWRTSICRSQLNWKTLYRWKAALQMECNISTSKEKWLSSHPEHENAVHSRKRSQTTTLSVPLPWPRSRQMTIVWQ